MNASDSPHSPVCQSSRGTAPAALLPLTLLQPERRVCRLHPCIHVRGQLVRHSRLMVGKRERLAHVTPAVVIVPLVVTLSNVLPWMRWILILDLRIRNLLRLDQEWRRVVR